MRTEASLIVIGVGGHGRVVADAWLAARPDASLCFADDRPDSWGQVLLGFPVRGRPADLLRDGAPFHVAIGNNIVRQRMFDEFGTALARTIVHPRATVSLHASLGEGSLAAAGCVVAPGARVGPGVIVNHGAVVDHDCEVGAFTHVAPQASLGGAVRVGAGVLIGAGANVLPGVHIGDGAIIGAGAVVIRNVAAGTTVSGVPARNRF